MRSRLGGFIREQRKARGLTRGKLAIEVGYRNTSKGTNRLRALEDSGTAHPALLEGVVRVLELDAEIVEELTLADRDQRDCEWEQWADEPIRPYVVERLIPGVYRQLQIADEHLDDPQSYARQYAASTR